MRRHAHDLAGCFFLTIFGGSAPAAAQEAARADEAPQAAPPPPEEDTLDGAGGFDPLMVVGFSLVPSSGVLIGVGASILTVEIEEVCGLSGACIEEVGERDVGLGRAFMASGVTAGALGVTFGAMGIARAARREPTGSLELAGHWLVGTGLSTTAFGVGLAVDGQPDEVLLHATLIPGAILGLSGGAALLASAFVDDEAPARPGHVSGGIALATVGATAAPLGVMACASGTQVTGDMAAFAIIVFCVFPLASLAGLSAGGAILWAKGEVPPDEEPHPEISLDAGPAGVQLRGTW